MAHSVSISMFLLLEFCASRVEGLEGTEEGKVWRFIGASFSQDPANEYLQLLGLNLQEVTFNTSAEKDKYRVSSMIFTRFVFPSNCILFFN